ncbi:MAG: Crp/Fnr family transcriptional regulator, partial [Bacteroidota bacterium]
EFKSHFKSGSCKKGDSIQMVGDVCYNIYILKSGLVKQYRYKEDGSEHIIWFLFEEDLFTAFRSFSTQENSINGLEALEDCEFISMSRSVCLELAEKYRPIETFFRELMEGYYIESEDRLFFLQALSAKQKYLYLLEHMPQFLQRIPQKEISSFLGITRETLSRMRKYAAS